MGEIFTSYYNKAKELDPNRWEFVQISNSKPKWWDYPTTKIDAVVPPWYLVDAYKYKGMSWEKYDEEYTHYLNNENVEDALGLIEKLTERKNVVLLCHEPPQEPCHRHILARFMNSLGFEVTELMLK